ncbi:peptidase inhibitor family I36 protein [Streptomyces sp. TRM68367]|uniref:peptidase inhibitor family I36 protein n=1 Tax=Streptomyces sp. TRM68367 TaxID=2758415 RepID=UPI00165A8C8F|nr:peptidase inhibitor family I36 protein [Streptomyces sp. TRM68367]MBC9725783.1 peptidase inhibitor family I36 protein [Streptomyces sp. TRM68367]
MLRTVRAKISAALGAALVASFGVAASGTPAHAGITDCSAGALCLYTQYNFRGNPVQIFGNQPDLTLYPVEDIRSLYNNSPCTAVIYAKPNYAGDRVVLAGHTAVPRIEPNSPVGDEIASVRWGDCP